MSWHVVHLKDAAPSPWRNGGGTTRELAAWPEAQNWIWRMSVAEVAQGGPFSRFDGVQRWFAVLSGTGVRLTLEAQTHDLNRCSAPLSFDGAQPVDCQLLQGATQDFNLMVRGGCVAHMRRVCGVINVVMNATRTVAIYAIDAQATLQLDADAVTISTHSLAWQTLPAGTAVRVDARDALWMEIAP